MTAAVSVQVGVDSISDGALFAVLALLFGVMRLLNFAYGELIMVGGYTMYYAQDLGVVPMILITIAMIVIVSLLMELIAFRPVRHAPPLTLLITSFAISFGARSTTRCATARQRSRRVGTSRRGRTSGATSSSRSPGRRSAVRAATSRSCRRTARRSGSTATRRRFR